MGEESSCKVYVSTAAEFSADGFLRPLSSAVDYMGGRAAF